MSLAIKVENLSKAYQLGEIGTGTLGNDLTRWFAKVRGKEDPFLKIGETNDRTKKGTSNVVWSLKDINFEIQEGDAVGIIGRNGAGKSTLLKLLSRVTSPTTGNFKVKGRIASLLEVGTGFHPELSGRENIYLNGAILGMRKQEIKRKFDEIVDFSGVERYIDTPVKRYSSGMYVRLAFAVAAHLESETLIVDEVLAVGDTEFQKKCLGKMNDVSKGEGRTVLFVSHQMGSIAQLCNKCLLLQNGEVHFNGDTPTAINLYLSINNANTNGNKFVISDKEAEGKDIYIKEAVTINKRKNEIASDFHFEDSVTISLKIIVNKYVPNIKIAVALLDKFQNRIFTVVNDLDKFLTSASKIGIVDIDVELPDKLIAPNKYSFNFGVYIPNSHTFDIHDSKCIIQIFDSGTEFASYEGLDYGNIIVKSKWS